MDVVDLVRALGVALSQATVCVVLYRMLAKRIRRFARPTADAYADGHDAGYDAGWREGRRCEPLHLVRGGKEPHAVDGEVT